MRTAVALGFAILVLLSACGRDPEFAASGNSSSDLSQSLKVLGVGNLFLTYDSTAKDSALWIVRPPEMFMSSQVTALVRWNGPGRIVWSLTGNTTADFLIEFAPETNHRIAILRAVCTEST